MTTPSHPISLPIAELERWLELQHRTIAAIAHEGIVENMLSGLCQLFEERIPGVRCAVMLHSPSRERIELGAAPSLPDAFLTALDSMKVGPYAASSGAAVNSRQPAVAEDLRTDLRWKHYRAEAEAAGVRACWSVPLFRNPDRSRAQTMRDVLGTLDFYFTEPCEEDEKLLAIQQRTGEIVALVLRAQSNRPDGVQTRAADELTSLPDRATFWAHLGKLVVDRREAPSRFALAVVDIDQLKDINDTLGFKMGDLVLQALGERLSSLPGDDNLVARIGGDEFAILIQDLGRGTDISEVGSRIKEKVTAPYDFDGHDLFLTGSVGISVYPWDGMDENSLLRNAETALAHAKERGGSDYQLFQPTMVSDKPTFEAWWESSRLGSELRGVLEKNELELYYQLKFDAKSQKVCGAEALIRWNHPTLGLLSPARFVPMAERSGLILEIGEWVIRSSCKQLKKWLDSGLKAIPVSVNVSAQQFRHGRLVDRITKILKATGIEAKYLELEITESLAMEDKGHNLNRMEELHALGLPISIDDFGTGFSSLSYLTKFPIDTLKIDQSFIRDIGADRESDAIVRAIISLAQALSLKTVAEGVETEEQFQFVCEHGCDTIQGYYFSRPLPVDQVTQILLKRSG